jgi:hypothetical protein
MSKYDKKTYIGYLIKNHKGGFKIIEGKEDSNILEERDRILQELESVINSKTNLMYEDLEYYIKALEGKYIRNKICTNDNPNCNIAMVIVKKTLRKLLKKAMSDFKDLQQEILTIVRKNAPGLYKIYGGKIDELVSSKVKG